MNTTTNFLEFEKTSEETPILSKGLKKSSKKRTIMVTGVVLACLMIACGAYKNISKSQERSHKGTYLDFDPIESPREPWSTLFNMVEYITQSETVLLSWTWDDLAKVRFGHVDTADVEDVDVILMVPISTPDYGGKTIDQIKQTMGDNYVSCLITAALQTQKRYLSCSDKWQARQLGPSGYFSTVLNHKIEMDDTAHAFVMMFNKKLMTFAETRLKKTAKNYETPTPELAALVSQKLRLVPTVASAIGVPKSYFPYGDYDTTKHNFMFILTSTWSFKTEKNSSGQDVEIYSMSPNPSLRIMTFR